MISFPTALPTGYDFKIIHDSTDSGRLFLHDTAITCYNGRIIVAWYSCPSGEIQGESSIIGVYSDDDGKSWSMPFTIVSAQTNKSAKHFVPVIFLEDKGQLYCLISKMSAHDRPFALSLMKMKDVRHWEEVCDIFSQEDDLSVIINSNPVRTEKGTLICGGRFCKGANKYPSIPCAFICKGDITKWEVVALTDHAVGNCPETTIAYTCGKLFAVTRNPERTICYVSEDQGEHWQESQLRLPAFPVKLYAYTLEDKRLVVAFNHQNDVAERALLTLAVISPDLDDYQSVYTIATGKIPQGEIYHYPCIMQKGDTLFITCTVGALPRHAGLITFPVSSLK